MTFFFDKYTVRPVNEKDRAYIDKLTDHDPYHRGVMDADWFLKLQPGEGAYAIEDGRGEIVLYFKTQNAVRLSLQFGEQSAAENRDALMKGMAWLETLFLQNGFSEVIFDTQSPALKAMTKRRLGFAEMGEGSMTRPLGYKARGEAWHHQPTAFEEVG